MRRRSQRSCTTGRVLHSPRRLPRIGVGAPLPAAQGENQNALVAKAQAALDAKQWPEAEAALKQLLASEPRWEYSQALGTAQMNQGHYADSLELLSTGDRTGGEERQSGGHRADVCHDRQRQLETEEERRGHRRVHQGGRARPQSGRCLLQSLRDHVQHGPAGGEDRAFCDKAIAADPKKADAYFIKGSSLYGEGALDKSNKFIVPPGAVEALKQYLVLAPGGPHAQDVKAMLDALK